MGFDFDWPRYAKTGESQRVLDVTSIHRRGSSLLPVDPLRSGSTVNRFECGYLDLGARKKGTQAPLQAACFYHYVVKTVGDAVRNRVDPTDGLDVTAIAEPVPAGARGTGTDAQPVCVYALLLSQVRGRQ